MTISYSSVSSTYQTGQNSVTYRQPATLAVDDLILGLIVNKYPTNGPNTPTGMTLVDQQIVGDGEAPAADKGDAYITVYKRVSDGTEDDATETVSISGGNTTVSRSVSYSRSGGSGWDIATAYGSQGAAAASWSITTGSLDLASGDVVVVMIGKNADSDPTHSNHALSASGITFGAFTNRSGPLHTTQGDDCGYQIGEFPVTAGSGSVACTFTMDLSGGGSASGGVILVRLRETSSGGGGFQVAWTANANTMIQGSLQ